MAMSPSLVAPPVPRAAPPAVGGTSDVVGTCSRRLTSLRYRYQRKQQDGRLSRSG